MNWIEGTLSAGFMFGFVGFSWWIICLFRVEPNSDDRGYVEKIIKHRDQSYGEYVFEMTAQFIKAWLYGIPIYIFLGLLFSLE